MLKKLYRGLKPREISDLFQKKGVNSVSNRYFRINWMDSDQPHPRFVVITSAKLTKSALLRNKMRRRLYEMVRNEYSEWTRGVRVAILVKTPALTSGLSEFRNGFYELMRKAHLMND